MDNLAFGRFKAGDERVLALYFDRHVKALLFFAYRLVSEDFSAEELVQDAYVKLWSQRDTIENESHLKSFLYQVVYRAGIDLLRKNKHHTAVDIAAFDQVLLDLSDTPLARIIHAETLQLVYDEVSKLPKSQQQVFRLVFIEGFSTEEISQQLGMNANAVFVAKSKALAQLRQVFKDSHVLLILSSLLFSKEHLN